MRSDVKEILLKRLAPHVERVMNHENDEYDVFPAVLGAVMEGQEKLEGKAVALEHSHDEIIRITSGLSREFQGILDVAVVKWADQLVAVREPYLKQLESIKDSIASQEKCAEQISKAMQAGLAELVTSLEAKIDAQRVRIVADVASALQRSFGGQTESFEAILTLRREDICSQLEVVKKHILIAGASVGALILIAVLIFGVGRLG